MRGETTVRMVLDARPDYGRARFDLTARDGAVDLRCTELAMTLTSSTELAVEDGTVRAEFTLRTGQTAEFVLEVLDAGAPPPEITDVAAAFDATAEYWRAWLAQSRTAVAGARWWSAQRSHSSC